MSGPSRRTVLRGAGAAAFGVGSLAVLLLFDAPGTRIEAGTCVSTDVSDSEPELIISNWPAYIDPPKKPGSTLKTFEQRTGISVTYNVDYNDNAEFYAKVRNQLGACEPVKRDMFMSTDWMAARMVSSGWIQKLDAKRVPNLHDNLLPSLKNRKWDPDREYSAPWQSGLTGIAYNAAKTSEVRSMEELLTRDDLKGRVTLLSEMYDTMIFMLIRVGADPLDFDDDEWADAIDNLREVVDSGQIRAFTGNEYLQDLQAGNIVACEAWSGDIIQAQFDNPDIKFVVPEEGLSLWSDNMLVPNKAEHKANAEEWIDYYYEPEVAARLAAWVNYICPVKGAREAMEKVDPSLVDNELIFPDDEMLANAVDLMPLDADQTRRYEGDWADVTGG
ncbi:polyamine ABC transporter substrate-binding protein [Solicola gregarius]|uniref:Spermidine/putrescine ABC transporter substrate-binding protein n=1 Tax=Solicola gregarius TaxID=2908642 RepID=A0AA46YKD5_9ACTN|nr:spermidine/putrescine ABC transporter substrate-binding protein [Solicola gregarius]UYM04439.1 spermidine/putrescine ABC transporter substrate-binding protein [Solicola gregarius]